MRRLGVCNCPFKSGWGVAVCQLDGGRCRVSFEGLSIFCRGWLASGAPSALQSL
jgi:hypothetical protein